MTAPALKPDCPQTGKECGRPRLWIRCLFCSLMFGSLKDASEHSRACHPKTCPTF